MYVTNTQIIISEDNPYYEDILKYFVKIVEDEVKPLYELDEDSGEILIDKGLRFLLPKSVFTDVEDISSHDIDITIKEDPEFYRNILDGITLRDDQIMTVMKCLYHKRGVCQLPTGSGKTICIAAILKYYYLMLGYYPSTLIFEPTDYLVEDMISRFNSYGIPATKYKDHRKKVEGVTVSHPLSLYNDLKDEDLFDEVKIFIGDEFHHQSCNTWYSIYHNLENVEVCIGFSASIIDNNKFPITSLSNLEYEEAVIIGCTGSIIVNIPISFYIEKGILATPVLLRMSNAANEWVYDDRNWNQLRSKKLESNARTKIICDVCTLFNIINFKVLIITGTKKYAEKLVYEFKKYHIADKCILSYGGGVYLKMDKDGQLINCKDEDPKNKFKEGEYNIMIGTTHLLEGADVPNLDVICLPEIGKKARRLIQGVGRSLRVTKHGHYAYIIDFDDYMNGVLSHQSNLRMSMFKELIGVSSENIFDHCKLSDVKEIVRKLENY